MLFLALGILAFRGGGGFAVSSNLAILRTGSAYLVVSVGTIALHEAVHGLFFRIFGGRPRYGVGLAHWFLPYAYATSPGRFSVMQMTIIALAPFVILSLASLAVIVLVPALANLSAVVFVTNFSGAVGDLWMVREMARFRHCRDVWTVDSRDALEIHSADPAAQEIATRLAARNEDTKTIFIGWWLGASLVIYLTSMPLMIILTELNAGNVLIGPRQFPLFSYERTPDSFGISVDLGVLLVAGLLFALLRLLFDRRPNPGRVKPDSAGPPRPAFF